jgi:hypothetical protein
VITHKTKPLACVIYAQHLAYACSWQRLVILNSFQALHEAGNCNGARGHSDKQGNKVEGVRAGRNPNLMIAS